MSDFVTMKMSALGGKIK